MEHTAYLQRRNGYFVIRFYKTIKKVLVLFATKGTTCDRKNLYQY